MTSKATSLLEEVFAAHGGLETWNKFNKVSSDVVTGGFLWGMKGMPIDQTPRRITSEFKKQWTRTDEFGNPDWRMTWTPEHVRIETYAGETIAEGDDIRSSFAGHEWETQWNPLQLGYFNGYAMWTYYNLPFVLSEPGYEVSEIAPIEHEGELMRGLRARFPEKIHTHCREYDLFFDKSGLLRRQHYQVDVAGKSKAAHMISDYIDVQGLKFATKRRVFVRNEDGTPQLDKMTVSADLSNFELS